ncbi:polysaccharide pyruvyl transferase family protein [Salinimonas marina]|uniref:Polysaccharide pyruvyl transferase family protein n=1 Tax=Salinimonas marina TaxID=2785918 RepID=A0A7S9DW93_9ALTE|nr:polysaccharide pyruvyl transferase family protein [Salinimonas marina]QPG05139.1 polysaccharide pyruvyl transferase family protein [Salinimonas marina]
MKHVYHKDWRGNFGDDLNIPFFKDVLGSHYLNNGKKFYGIGTLLNNVHGKITDSIIFGSGYGYGEALNIDVGSVDIIGVRGPLTAEKLEIAEDKVIGDPALYLPYLEKFNKLELNEEKIVVALHHTTCELWDFEGYEDEDIKFLDPASDIYTYIAHIKSAKFVITESLHGAIVAAAYRKPFLPLSLYVNLEMKKWQDFYRSLNIDNSSIINLEKPAVPSLRYIATRGKFKKFLEPRRKGVAINEEYMKKIKSIILSNDKELVLVEEGQLEIMKERFEAAISEYFSRY